MRREADLATVRHQVSMLAEQVVSLVDVISSQAGEGAVAGAQTGMTRSQIDILEHLLGKLRQRQARLRTLLN